ncbi:hypothetical protein NADFUDRAFT_67291 [Nadsonia fulvescens var. elongata DSM 6958]|uniref:Uncharacterized protein n=1 Tax=Nadsonia fulvescens var. elongata DSM 6958 TaxID=857566 RepID=A0A1E3PES8_9ASCO|nr:hypothetical protein NADFUDRAFT_67291 [Nadsonia fulvescens var. elongata DSM 6958]
MARTKQETKDSFSVVKNITGTSNRSTKAKSAATSTNSTTTNTTKEASKSLSHKKFNDESEPEFLTADEGSEDEQEIAGQEELVEDDHEKEEQNEEEEDSDDDAPEEESASVSSKSAQLAQQRFTAMSNARQIEKGKEREKRRKAQEVLLEQKREKEERMKQKVKKIKFTEPDISKAASEENGGDEDMFLPEELLDQVDDEDLIPSVNKAKHFRLDQSEDEDEEDLALAQMLNAKMTKNRLAKKKTSTKKGPVTVSVLGKKNKTLAPKAEHKVTGQRAKWLKRKGIKRRP